MNNCPCCPCCSGQLLLHCRRSGTYWFCRHCYQEMPNLSSIIAARHLNPIAKSEQKPPYLRGHSLETFRES